MNNRENSVGTQELHGAYQFSKKLIKPKGRPQCYQHYGCGQINMAHFNISILITVNPNISLLPIDFAKNYVNLTKPLSAEVKSKNITTTFSPNKSKSLE